MPASERFVPHDPLNTGRPKVVELRCTVRVSRGRGKCRRGQHSIPEGERYFEFAELVDGTIYWGAECERSMLYDDCRVRHEDWEEMQAMLKGGNQA